MNRYPATILVVLLGLLVIVGITDVRLTGLAFDTNAISINVGPNTNGEIVNFSVTSAVEVDNDVSLQTTFNNTGSSAYAIIMSIFVLNGTTIYQSYIDTKVTLTPGSTRTFSATYTPSVAGTYEALTNVTFSIASVASTNTTFTVTSPEQEEPPGPGIVGGGGGPSRPPGNVSAPEQPQPEKGPELTLSFPQTVTLPQGETASILVIAKNQGNEPLTNLILSAKSDAFEIDILPSRIATLAAGDDVVFLVTIQAPAYLPVGTYFVVLEATATEDSISGTMAVIVSDELTKLEHVCNQIEELNTIIGALTGEIAQAALEGKDIAEADALLKKAAILLKQAGEACSVSDVTNADHLLKEAREIISDVVVAIGIAQPRLDFLFIIVFLLLAILIVLLLHLLLLLWRRRKKKEKKKPKKKSRVYKRHRNRRVKRR
ncbi:MAG: hypothetical protein KKA90_05075 [Nanoarchaeota archaeon]|nr:hypothetical protein [Nanoarchaeota archaeon]